jgi:hypothetical protein
MKKFLLLSFAALLLAGGCNKNGETPVKPELSATPETIQATAAAGSYTIDITSNVAWTATVNSGATWCAVSPAAATGNGTLTVNVAENPATAPRAATVTVTADTLSRNVTVLQAGKSDIPPPHAASTQTWTFGDQIWSDAIQIPECNKTSFTNSYDVPHCRSYTTNNITYYYYNWAYVNTNGTNLCASPWRVPSQSDFEALTGATSGGELTTVWGLPGYAYGSSMNFVGEDGLFWSSSENDTSYAYNLSYTSGNLGVSNANPKLLGFQVRCVR